MAKQVKLNFVTGQKFNNDGSVMNVRAVELDLDLIQLLLALDDVIGIFSLNDSDFLKNTTAYKMFSTGRVPVSDEIRKSVFDRVLVHAAQVFVDSTVGARDSFEDAFERNLRELSQFQELSKEEVRGIAHRNALVSLVGNWVANVAATGKVR
jgi:hypothetical protein